MSENSVLCSSDVVDLELPCDFTRPAEAEAKLRESLKTRPGTDVVSIEILTQVARAEALQGKLEDAEETLRKVKRRLASTPDVSLAAKFRYLLELGRVFTLKRTPSRAREPFLEVWEQASKCGEEFYAIDAAQMMSVIETHKAQVDWIIRALAIAEKSTNPRVQKWRATLYQQLGWHYTDLLQLQKALEYFQKAAACLREEGETKKAIAATCCVARTLRVLKKADEALEIMEGLHAEMKRIGGKDGLVYEEMAECLHAKKRTADAQKYFELAYELLSKDEWLVDNKAARIKRLKTLAAKPRDKDRD